MTNDDAYQADPPTAPTGLRMKLAIMMFLQFFIWGAWFEIGFSYIPALKFTSAENGWIFGAFNIGALVALFFSTQLADRTFAAEKFLAFSHLIGGLSIGALFFLHPAPGAQAEFLPFFVLLLIHSMFYVPTVSITNSIAFANLKNPAKEFGPIRVWGTVGWIAASWPFIFILVDWTNVPKMGDLKLMDWLGEVFKTPLKGDALLTGQSYIFLVAGIASLLLAAFSLGLPHTPPKKATGEDSLAWLKALKLLKNPFVLVLFLVTFIDAAVHQSYFFWTYDFLKSDNVGIAANWAGPVMKIGQIAEILTMLVLGFVLKTFGWRLTMIVGVLGHAGRFAVFAFYPDQNAVIFVNLLHGICYAFFFATVYIFVDEYFPKDIRSSAQGLFNVLILGIGPFAANFACGILGEKYKTGTGLDYQSIFTYSMSAALLGAALLLLFFHTPKKESITT